MNNTNVMTRIAVISQRDFSGNISYNPQLIKFIAGMFPNPRFISGNSKGNEQLLLDYCKNNSIEFVSIPPEHSASIFESFLSRNNEIINHSDIVIVIYDGYNKFAINAINYATACNKICITFPINPQAKFNVLNN